MTAQEECLLEIEQLVTELEISVGRVRALDGVSLTIKRGETLGLVGESGCGKSLTSLSIMKLLPKGIGRITEGKIRFQGQDLVPLSEDEMRSIRGNQISMIFQEPMTSLNPVLTIGEQIGEVLRIHQKLNRKEAKEKAIEMLQLVGIPSPEKRFKQYPHELSGGMRQRVMIAIALACKPTLLIADEPTTALDVTIQAQIIHLMKELQGEFGMAILFITHDLGVVAETCDRVCVMYAGQVVEEGETQALFREPYHPYTEGLLASIPKLTEERERLEVIPGHVPGLHQMSQGCRFAPRCAKAKERCHVELPPLRELSNGRKVRCWKVTEREQATQGKGAEVVGKGGVQHVESE
ncbi:ABC transporter ATP-binding protein [Rubeoparvulum massiliense]|uniref:ABC transporter ATP-binding protein n=1 Tax=Rubeoparvulum massiliense TaxID=1631346 RepID=UPI00065E388C|nr:ABC transporter ATP-binding protein [Rubeoparvulum massiliense]